LKLHFHPVGPSIQTEFLAKSISGIGMPMEEANSSHSEEEQIGSLVEVTFHPAREMERDEWVVVKVWSTGWE
jgi:hypothetical protein